jgi:pyruvate, water dikinase
MNPSCLVKAYRPLDPSVEEQFQLTVSRGFFLTAQACRDFVAASGKAEELDELYGHINRDDPNEVMLKSFKIRKLFTAASLTPELVSQIEDNYSRCSEKQEEETDLVIFPRGTNPLNNVTRVSGLDSLLTTVKKIYVDHLANGIITKFEDDSYDYTEQSPELTIQTASLCEFSGLVLNYEPKSGARDLITVFSTWGLAEDLLRRTVSRDEYFFHKSHLKAAIHSQCGEKEFQLSYDFNSRRMEHLPLSRSKARSFSLTEEQALHLAGLLHHLEQTEDDALELTFSGDGDRLEVLGLTRHPQPERTRVEFFHQTSDAEILVRGRAVGHAVSTGKVRIMHSRDDIEYFQKGEVLVARQTQPDWEPAFRKASAIVTEKDRRVSHSTILAREMGLPCILQARDCAGLLKDGQMVTVSCSKTPDGVVLDGKVPHEVEEFSLQRMPNLRTQLMVNLSMPERALSTAQLPWAGAGLVRSEFMIGSRVKIHPLALLNPERLPAESQTAIQRLTHRFDNGREYFLTRMSQAIALIAAAFHPRPITLRFSDFKSEEYARLLGGETFEPKERNSLLGWRGASRYLHPEFADAFHLELESVRRVRVDMGFKNLKVMIPFCRTPEEGCEVIEMMKDMGLKQGEDGLEVWAMAELPSNVLLADEFAQVFDGLSIGSSDLTGLTMGVDRNSDRLSDYFDELHPAMMKAYEMVVEAAHRQGKPASFCGQAASEDPEFVALLAEMGLDAVSLAPDALHSTLERLTERKQ